MRKSSRIWDYFVELVILVALQFLSFSLSRALHFNQILNTRTAIVANYKKSRFSYWPYVWLTFTEAAMMTKLVKRSLSWRRQEPAFHFLGALLLRQVLKQYKKQRKELSKFETNRLAKVDKPSEAKVKPYPMSPCMIS